MLNSVMLNTGTVMTRLRPSVFLFALVAALFVYSLARPQPARAVEMFETSLIRMPLRPRSLLGLARARASVDDQAGAAEAYGALTEVWAGRESFEGMREARRQLHLLLEPP